MSDSATAIAAAPIVHALQPLISAVVAMIASGAVTVGIAVLSKWTGVTVQSAYVERLRQAAQTEAGVLVAEAADNLSSRSISVTSPVVAAAAARIEAALPQAIAAAGMTPEALCRLVAGEIGKLQAHTTAVPVPPSTAQPKAL